MTEVPTLIKRVGGGVAVTWRDGHEGTYAYGYLRSICPRPACSEVETPASGSD